MHWWKFYTPADGLDCGNKLIQVAEIDKPEWRESRRRVYSTDGLSPTLHGIDCGGNTEPKIMESNNKSQNELIQVGTLTGGIYDTSFDCIKRVYSTQGISPTINTCGGGHREPKIVEDNVSNNWGFL